MENDLNNKYQNNSLSSDEDWTINFNELLKITLKNIKLITLITLIGFIISCLNALNKKNIYAGQFQILVKSSGGTNPARGDFASSIASLTGSTNQLSTEIEILKSPSVLNPVFEFVKERKKLSGINVEKMKYSSWYKNNMEVELVPGTNVLDLTYKDTDKDTIMTTLEVI